MIRILGSADAGSYFELRRKMLTDSPLAFTSSPEDDIASSIEAVDRILDGAPDQVIFGVFDDRLVGAVGVYRDRHRKAAHKAHVWGMYVVPERRGEGLGKALLDAALGHARKLAGVDQVQLSVSSAARTARRLYDAAGFVVWGREHDSLRHDGESVVEHHMVLALSDPAATPGPEEER